MMLTKFNLKGKMVKQRGIGLLELMLALAIIAVLLIMATRYYQSANQAQKINQAVSDVNAMVAGAEAYRSSNPGTTAFTITDIIAGGYLPRAWAPDAKGVNPWSGDYTDTIGETGNIDITVTNVPGETCKLLAGRLKDATEATCSTDTMTAVYGTNASETP